ncbi:MAG: hypothetical protein R3D53_04560 [Paracoccaceae bacterium]
MTPSCNPQPFALPGMAATGTLDNARHAAHRALAARLAGLGRHRWRR